MANVTVTVSKPNVTVSTANISNVSVSESTSNVVVSSVATVANGEVITGLLSVTDAGGDGSLSYANSTGVFTYTGPSAAEVRSHFSNTSPITLSAGVIGVDSAALFTGKTTDDLPQGTSNIYFSTSGATVNTDNLPETVTNQYFTTSRFDTSFASKSTDNLGEGASNLYFTNARADARANVQIAAAPGIVRTTTNQTVAGVKEFTNVINGTGGIELKGNVSDITMTSFVGANTRPLAFTMDAVEFTHQNAGNVTFASPQTFTVGAGSGNGPADFNRPIAGNKFYNRDGNATVNSGALSLDDVSRGATLQSNKNINLIFDQNGDATSGAPEFFGIFQGTNNISTATKLFSMDHTGNANVNGQYEVGSGKARSVIVGTHGGNGDIKFGIHNSGSVGQASHASLNFDPFTDSGTIHLFANTNNGFIKSNNMSLTGSIQSSTASANTTFTNLIKVRTNSADAITLSNTIVTTNLPLTVTGNLSVNGNIDATGNINYQNVTDLFVRDQKITLNANATTDATVEIIANRPQAGTNTLIRWNETSDVWQFTNDGSTFYNIPASTSDLAEGTNLYYTDARFDTRLGTKTTDNLTQGSTNKYFTTSGATVNTDALTEGSTNLYYTTGRANLAIQGYQGTINTPGAIDSGGITTNQLISNNIIKTNKLQSFDTTTGMFINDNGNFNQAPIINIALRSKNDSNVAITEGFKIQGSTLANGEPGSGNLSDLMIVNPLGGVDFRLDSGNNNVSDGGDFNVHATGMATNTFVVKRSGNVDIKQQLNLTGPTNSNSDVTTTANISGNVITATTGLISNKVESTANSNISLDTNTKAVKILKDFASVTSQDTLTLDSDGYRPTTYNTVPSYSGTGLRRNTLHEGTATAGSPVVTVTKSAVAFWYGTPSAAQRTNAFANLATNCMFVTQASASATGNNTTTPFPVGTRILSVDATAFTITMTQNATADATFSQASSTGLFCGDGAHDPSTTFGELYVTLKDFSNPGGSDQTIEFAQFTGSTDNLSYGEAGPLTADLTRSVASGTITVGTYAVQQKSKLIANKGYTESKNGFTVGEGGSLTTRFENDNFATKGINIFHDGQSTFSTQFTNPSFNSQYGIKQYTDNCLQNSFPTQGPRLLLSSAKGKNTDDSFGTYPRSGQSLGQIAWQATTGTALTPSSLRPPVYINAIAAEDHSLGSNTNVYFGAMSNSDNQASSNKAHIYLATQDGRTILAAGEKGTTKEDIYFAPALQPNPGYAVPTTYDFSTVAGQKAWAKMNYANTSATSGAQLTVTHGQSRGAGTVGDQVLKLQRADNSFSLTGQVINADNSPNNVFGPGVFGQSFDCIGSIVKSGNYVDGTAAVISGFTGSPYAALNGTTKFLKFLGALGGGLDIFELYNDAGLTSGFTSGASGVSNLGPGVFTYSAVQASGVTAKAYSIELEEQNNILKIKEDAAVRLSIDTTETELFNRLQLYSLTTTEINALASPQAGQVVYNSTLNQMCLYNGSAWQKITQATM